MEVDNGAIIDQFIEEMKYKKNNHVLGVFSYATNESRSIGLIVVYDNNRIDNMYKGLVHINNYACRYFECSINNLYLDIDEKYDEQNNDYLYLIGSAKIIFDVNGSLAQLQEYVKNTYEDYLPLMEIDEAYNYITDIDRIIKKMKLLIDDDSVFYSLYYLTLEKIRKVYHQMQGYPQVDALNVIKAYTDEDYQKEFFKKDMPEEKFIGLYLSALNGRNFDKELKLEKLYELFNYIKRDLRLNLDEYRIPIRKRIK